MENESTPKPNPLPPQVPKIDAKQVIEMLSAKWKGKACPMCNSGPWNLGDGIYELREFHGGSLVIGPNKIIPVVAVTCANCGNTQFINAVSTGLIPKEAK